jgi:hypothetical protein
MYVLFLTSKRGQIYTKKTHTHKYDINSKSASPQKATQLFWINSLTTILKVRQRTPVRHWFRIFKMFQVPLVLIQAASKSETLFTFWTGEGFRARMGRQVSCQVVVPRKSFVAKLALERALTSVQQLMNL